ncbi:MAG: acyl-CoA thioesterase I [Parcubacteria bacterium C7867-004]|nr:MAG: acyl-CoA thioesterase I [Parcubacteria bacterium C7867-004]
MKAAYVLISLAAIALIGGGVWFFTRSEKVATCAELSMKPVVVAFGDSLVEGYGAGSGEDFVSVLSRDTGIPIQNLGRSGDTTATGLKRVKDVVALKPDIVIVLLGGNDALQRINVAETEQNLTEILRTIKNSGATPILVGVIGGFPSDPFAPVFKRIAEGERVVLIPNILSGLITNKSLMSDAIHPNAAGYTKVAERIRPELDKACTDFGG